MASTVMQVYLKQVLETYFHAQTQIRIASLGVISLVLRQGLVHPVQVTIIKLLLTKLFIFLLANTFNFTLKT